MTDWVHRLSGGIRHLSIASVFAKSFGLINASVLFIYLTRHDYGMLALAFSLFGVTNFLSGLAQGELVVSRFSQSRGAADLREGETLLRSFYLLSILSSIAVTAMAWVVTSWSGKLAVVPASTLGTGLICVLLTPLRNMTYVHFQSRESFDRIRRFEIAQNVIQTSGYVLFIFAFGLGLTGALMAYALSRALPPCIGGRFLARDLWESIRSPSLQPMFALITGEGKWLAARWGVVTAEGSARPWLILLLLGTEAVALFEAAKTVIGMSNDVVPMKQVLLPMMSRSTSEPRELKSLYERASRYGAWLYGIGGIAVILLSPLVFTYIFPKYRESIPLMQIMAANLFVVGFSVPQTPIFFALGQQRFLLVTATLGFSFLFALGIPAMLTLGITGMALAFVASGAILVMVRYRYLCRLRPEMAIEWKTLFRYDKEDGRFLSGLIFGFRNKPT